MMDARARHNFRASAIAKVITDEMVWANNKLATAVQKKLKRVLNTQGTGVKWPSLPKRSSRPYMPPVVQTGTLIRSWTTKNRGFIKGKRALFLGSPLNYARWLEEGTENMFPRPYLEYTLKWARVDRDAIAEKVGQRIQRKLRSVDRTFKKLGSE